MNKTVGGLVLAALIGALVFGMVAFWSTDEAVAKGKPGGGGKCPDVCPRPCIACADVWDPVVCSDGNTYGNACEAAAASVSVASEGECL